jgi:cyanate lyase
MGREEVTQKIIAAKMAKGLKWADVAARVGRSKEWTTAALLGQMPMSKEEAEAAGAIFELAEDTRCMQAGPYRGSLGQTIPTDPLIYRFYEIVQVYGTTFKALIEEEFGDGYHECHRFHNGCKTGAGRERAPGDRHAQWQVSALQEVLSTGSPSRRLCMSSG